MRILWLVNKVIPCVAEAMGRPAVTVNEGWISQMFDQFCALSNYSMCIVCGDSVSTTGSSPKFEWATYEETRESESNYVPSQKQYFCELLAKYQPDLIHVWGSEYPHTLAMVHAATELQMQNRVVVSLQGVISVIASFYTSGLSQSVVKYRTLFDRIRRTNIEDQQQQFVRRGVCEVDAIQRVKHVIGRTEWDHHVAQLYNPDICYHFCNETLRSPFYVSKWEYSTCQKYRIFISQATYPIKGFHLFLEILPALVARYPDIEVYIAGADLTDSSSWLNRLKRSSYGHYLKQRIESLGVRSHLHFLGRMHAEAMRDQYLQANLFLSSSVIENSPNSVGEAMILGTPVVTSDVGGVRSIIQTPQEGLSYKWYDLDALYHCVCDVFDNPEMAIARAESARCHAMKTHDAEVNFDCMQQIYAKIIESNTK